MKYYHRPIFLPVLSAIALLLQSCDCYAATTVLTPRDGVHLTVSTEEVSGGTSVTIKNDGLEGVITMISFDAPIESISSISVIESNGTIFFRSSPGSNLPGGRAISWPESAVFFTAEPPPPKNGISPTESVTFRFFGISEEELISGSTMIGFYIQSLSDGSSMTSAMTIIPEPKSALLGGLGLLTLLTRRNTKRNAITI